MSRLSHVLGLGAVAAVAALAAAPVRAQDAPSAPQRACSVPSELTRLEYALPYVARRLAAGLPIKIVAMGSSSTSGAGASSPAMTYPSRLEAELKALFPRVPITVLNKGVGGETTREMLARFDNDIVAEHPHLVIWQVGSNSLLKQLPIQPAKANMRQGLAKIKATGADIVLMNPQYAPKVLSKPNVDRMVDLINDAAAEAKVDLFQRFAIMRTWRLTDDTPFQAFLSPDELHLNDWSYGCIAKLLAEGIADAAMRPTVTAGATNRAR